MKILNPSEYGKKYGYTAKVVIKMCHDGILKYEKTEGGHYKICDCNDGMVTLEEYTKLLIEYEKLKDFIVSIGRQVENKVSETQTNGIENNFI